MNLEITPEVIVKQLGLGNTQSVLDQTKNAIKNTKNFDMFSKHIIGLNDKLKHMNGYIALSNSEPYFKIKCDFTNDTKEIINEFIQEVNHFSQKYHVNLKKVDNKEVYYILGRDA